LTARPTPSALGGKPQTYALRGQRASAPRSYQHRPHNSDPKAHSATWATGSGMPEVMPDGTSARGRSTKGPRDASRARRHASLATYRRPVKFSRANARRLAYRRKEGRGARSSPAVAAKIVRRRGHDPGEVFPREPGRSTQVSTNVDFNGLLGSEDAPAVLADPVPERRRSAFAPGSIDDHVRHRLGWGAYGGMRKPAVVTLSIEGRPIRRPSA
jgi:hypothetical protein